MCSDYYRMIEVISRIIKDRHASWRLFAKATGIDLSCMHKLLSGKEKRISTLKTILKHLDIDVYHAIRTDEWFFGSDVEIVEEGDADIQS